MNIKLFQICFLNTHRDVSDEIAHARNLALDKLVEKQHVRLLVAKPTIQVMKYVNFNFTI